MRWTLKPATFIPGTVPELASYLSRMTTWGGYWGGEYLDDIEWTYDQRLNHIYYDAIRCQYNIADYTGDSEPWNTYAANARDLFIGWLSPSWAAGGIWNYSTGLLMDYQRTSNSSSRDGVIGLSEHAVYSVDGAALPSNCQRMRETGLAIITMLNAQELGEPVRDRYSDLLDCAYGHIDQVLISKTYRATEEDIGAYYPEAVGGRFYQPFMFAIECQALIKHYQKNGGSSIPPLIKQAFDTIWDETWVSADAAFWLWWAAMDEGDPVHGVSGAKDLNLLIAPIFGWLYTMYGEPYMTRGNLMWEKGVQSADLSVDGKHFDQNYMWSRDYINYITLGHI